MGFTFWERTEKWWQAQLKNQVEKLSIERASLAEIIRVLGASANLINLGTKNLSGQIKAASGSQRTALEIAREGAELKLKLGRQEQIVEELIGKMNKRKFTPKHTAQVPKPVIPN